MKCPVCHEVRMKEIEKDGVLIDVCPDCKGVWLDRDELDKLLEGIREIRPAFNEWSDSRTYKDDDDRRRSDRSDGKPYNDAYNPRTKQDYHKPKKKKSVLDVFGDLFD